MLFARGFRRQIMMPAHLADELADEATAYEGFVTERVRDGQDNLEAFTRWRKEHGR